MPNNFKQAILTVHDDEKADLFPLHMSALNAKASCQWWRHIPHKFQLKNIYLSLSTLCREVTTATRTTLALSPTMSNLQLKPCDVNDRANFLSSAKVIVRENELKPGAIKVETQFRYNFSTISDNPGQKNIHNFLKPELKLASKLAGFMYCELH